MFKSSCCDAKLEVNEGEEGTNYYICSNCDKPCNILLDNKSRLKGDYNIRIYNRDNELIKLTFPLKTLVDMDGLELSIKNFITEFEEDLGKCYICQKYFLKNELSKWENPEFKEMPIKFCQNCLEDLMAGRSKLNLDD